MSFGTNRYERALEALESTITAPDDPEYSLPHLFHLRSYQQPIWDALPRFRKAFLLWHRRAGKDKLCFNYMVKKAWERIANYYYIFPTYSQAKKAIWEGRDKDGIAFLDHIPPNILHKKNQNELKIVLTNGSIIRLVGADDIDALMGTPPYGVIFSEYSLQSPHNWDYIRPILAENGGWAIFNGTSRGKNHFYDLYNTAKNNPTDWLCSLLTVDDTGAIPPEELAKEKLEMSTDMFEQEYYCSFTRGQEGSFYGKYLAEVDKDGRITNVPYDPYAPVDTFWDLGVGDSTAIVFVQRIGQEIHIIDFYEMCGEGLNHYAKVLKDKPYLYGTHYAPHDIKVRELGSGARTRLELARDLGLNFEIVLDLSIYEGIELTRSIFSKCWFDEIKCKHLLKCLLNYVKRYNETYNVYSDQPLHNYASHAADAIRMMGVTYSQTATNSKSLAEIEWEERKWRKFV